ncbi:MULTISPECIES: hypothetical protein [Bradyrhizobium]|uniref:hypothetical protein n=1 Tax=Bradyrhizobium TaxID=374 RepID=UPI0011780DBB|nr:MULTISPECIES: hypothetical protein [Bradyrhizobium]WOH61867.1 hypothetical protein RX329_17935 [Bradyrhizobium sp. BWC-3-1]
MTFSFAPAVRNRVSLVIALAAASGGGPIEDTTDHMQKSDMEDAHRDYLSPAMSRSPARRRNRAHGGKSATPSRWLSAAKQEIDDEHALRSRDNMARPSCYFGLAGLTRGVRHGPAVGL